MTLKSIITLTFLTVCKLLFAQEAVESWNTVVNHSDFEIKVQKQNCSKPTTGVNKEYVFLKLINKSSKSVKLSYQIEKWYDGVCSNCGDGSDASVLSVELSAGESLSGDCDNYRNRNLAVFSKMTGKSQARKLTSYKVIPLSVNGEKL